MAEGRIPSPSGRRCRQRRGMRAGLHHDDLQPLAPLQKVVELKPAFAFGRTRVALSQDPAEPAIGRAVLWINKDVRAAVDEYETCAGNDPCARHRLKIVACERMRAHNTGERVAIGDPDPGEAEFGGARGHLLGMRGSAQKGKIRHRRQFGEPRLKPDQGGAAPSACEKVGQNKDRTTISENASAKALPETPAVDEFAGGPGPSQNLA